MAVFEIWLVIGSQVAETRGARSHAAKALNQWSMAVPDLLRLIPEICNHMSKLLGVFNKISGRLVLFI